MPLDDASSCRLLVVALVDDAATGDGDMLVSGGGVAPEATGGAGSCCMWGAEGGVALTSHTCQRTSPRAEDRDKV